VFCGQKHELQPVRLKKSIDPIRKLLTLTIGQQYKVSPSE